MREIEGKEEELSVVRERARQKALEAKSLDDDITSLSVCTCALVYSFEMVCERDEPLRHMIMTSPVCASLEIYAGAHSTDSNGQSEA
jgi:hypothetical protein